MTDHDTAPCFRELALKELLEAQEAAKAITMDEASEAEQLQQHNMVMLQHQASLEARQSPTVSRQQAVEDSPTARRHGEVCLLFCIYLY